MPVGRSEKMLLFPILVVFLFLHLGLCADDDAVFSGSGGSPSAASTTTYSAAPPPLAQIQILKIVTNCLLKPWPMVQQALQNCTSVPSSRIVLFGPPTVCDTDTNIKNYTAVLTLVGAESPGDLKGPLQLLLRGKCSRFMVYQVIQETPDAPLGLSPPEATTLMWIVTGLVVVFVFGLFFLTILRRISFVANSKRQLREFFSAEPMSELKSVVDEDSVGAAARRPLPVPPPPLQGDAEGDEGNDRPPETEPLAHSERRRKNPVDLL